MNQRPFCRKSIADLEVLAVAHQDDARILVVLLDELRHRGTARALLLRDKVSARLTELRSKSKTSLVRPDNGNVSNYIAQVGVLGGTENAEHPQVHAMTSDESSNPERNRSAPTEAAQRAHALPDEMQDAEKLVAAFKYLKKLAEYARKIVYAIEDYGQLRIFEHDLAGLPGVRFNTALDGEPIWIRIDRLRKESAPEPDSTTAAWLSFDRQGLAEPEIVTSRMATVSDDEAQVLVDEGLVREENVRVNLEDALRRDVTFLIDDSEDAKTAVQQYVQAIWRPWAEQEGKRRRTISHYERLFTLHKSIESEGAEFPLELVCAIGLARQKLGHHRINTPVIEQLVEVEMAGDSSLLVRPRQRAPFVGLAPFGGSSVASIEHVTDVAGKHFASMVALSERELNPFDPESFSPVLSAAATYLDKSGRYLANERPADRPRDPTLPSIEETLIVTDTWALFVRNRSDDFYIQDLDRLMRKIAEPQGTDSVPAVGRRLVTVATGNEPSEDELDFRKTLGEFGPGTGQTLGDPVAGDPNSSRRAATSDSAAPEAAGTNGFFLPLPFNEEQIEILRRLERDGEVGVVVQGPPGTGKSHTIANIICHYLATGRRVLVTSKGEPALAVLRDKIPEAVRQLTINLLTNEREGLKQLERAIGILSEEISQTDIPGIERELHSTVTNLAGLKGRLSQIESRLLELGTQQLKQPPSYLIEHLQERSLASLAKWCADRRAQFDWLDDRPSTSPQDWNLSDAEMDDLRAARLVLKEDISYVGVTLPNVTELPDVAQVTAVHADLVAATQIAERAASGEIVLLSERVDRAFERAQALRKSISEILEIRSATVGWTASLLDRTMKTGRPAENESSLDQLLARLRSLARERKRFLGRPVEGLELASLSAEVVDALSRASRGDRPFGMSPFGRKQARLVVSQVRVAGVPPSEEADWAHASAWAEWLESLQRFVHLWNAVADEEGAERLQLEPAVTGRWLTRTASLVERLEHAATQHIPLIREELNVLFPRGLDVDLVLHHTDYARSALQHIDDNLSRARLLRADEDRAAWVERARTVPGDIGQRLLVFLGDSIGNPSRQQREISKIWDDLLSEIRRLTALQRSMSTVDEIGAKVRRAGFATWAARLRRESCASADVLVPANWREAGLWAVAEAHLDRLECRDEMRALLDERQRKNKDAEKAMQRLVALTTTRALAKKIRGSDLVGAALAKFGAAMRQIGRGTGIRAPRFRRMAQEAMRNCYGAVPCWIMPAWRVSEMLPSELESFHLVIVDEASQSDASALAALVRGKKVLIVGDDRQVSPAAVGTEEGFIRQLRHSYLRRLPHGDLMLPGASLYDLAGAMFPGQRIMLREHFRCVEPIIRYSNRFYNREIMPLRIPTASERIDPPLVDVYVRDGVREGKVNRREAMAIVDEINRLTQDSTFTKRTIGVISLIGHEQAHHINQLLYHTLDQDTYIRHQIECGDSATFQGKEKDIVFLSMVASPGQAKAVSGMMYEQRFNVAVSRARDRIYLFRSVRRENLSSGDLKAQLIEHFENPMPRTTRSSSGLIERCEGPFEPEVFARLSRLGYAVTPQVRSGPFRIDLVVEGANDHRLAIELDGDRYHPPEQWAEDFRRQQILERVGWRFWRCFASTFARNPDGVMGELIQELTKLGIEPCSDVAQTAHYTEYREWPRDETTEEVEPAMSAEMSETLPGSSVVEVGDRVVLLLDGEGGRQYTISLSGDRHDPENGIWSAQHVLGQALIGAEEEDVIEVDSPQGVRRATILKVDKTVAA